MGWLDGKRALARNLTPLGEANHYSGGSATMMAFESAIHDFLRDHAEAQTRFLAEIVKVPSDNPPGDCDRSAAVVATLLEGLGFQVEKHKVPESLVKAKGMISATNLIARRRFGQGGRTIALNAHGDVVPPGSGWTHDPYGAEIVDGWMVGRGNRFRRPRQNGNRTRPFLR